MLPEEVTKLIGKRSETIILEVEKSIMQKYMDAISNDSLYSDADLANMAELSAMIMPYSLMRRLDKWDVAMSIESELYQEAVNVITKAGYSNILDGGREYEFYAPVLTGETLIAESVILDIQEKEGKIGKMLVTIIETTYRNTNGSLIFKERKMTIQRRCLPVN